MAQDTSAKKSNFLSAAVANAVALKAVREEARRLTEELSSDAIINGIVDGDCVGANAHLTRTVVNNYLLSGITTALENMLTNGAVATSNRMPALMAMLPN